MADFPTGIYSPRTKENKTGVVYDATKSKITYAEDVTKLDAEVVAIETELGASPKGSFASVAALLKTLNTVVALTDGATPALNAALGHIFTLSAGGNRTIAVPSNAVTGQKIIIRHYANGAARTLALNTGANGFRFGLDITALTETASGKTDYIGCIWNATDSKWDVVAYIKGF
jgi:hypothetical protein